MKVLKFGGTSVKDAKALRQVKDIISRYDSNIVVVVSAAGGTTDELLKIANMANLGDSAYLNSIDSLQKQHVDLHEELVGEGTGDQLNGYFDQLRRICEGVFLLKELTNKSQDFILGTGELLSSVIMTSYLESSGLQAKWWDSRELIVTNDRFGQAIVNFEQTGNKLREAKKKFDQINILPGFIASTEANEMTTLGRGGSDYTASIIAAEISAELLEIWTDVDGIMTADPRRVKPSQTLNQVSYEEALELSYFGAKVIYAQSIAPVLKTGIEVKVMNTFSPEKEGTLITSDAKDSLLIKGISSIDNISILSIVGSSLQRTDDFFPRLFKALGDYGISIVFMTHSNAALTVTLGFRTSIAGKAYDVLKEEFNGHEEQEVIQSTSFEKGYALLALIGSNMKDQIGVSGTMFNVLGRNGISIKAISQGSSERNISAIIPKEDLDKALNVLHESFFLSKVKRINLFIIGVGNVGEAFLSQLSQQFLFLKENHQLNIKVIGVANSRIMAFEKDGIPLSKWKDHLAKGEKFTKEAYIKKMVNLNYRSAIFVDITASNDIASMYLPILEESISVVTPNKIAATRSQEHYLNLKAATKKYHSQFLIETNVCAGLPILSTLNDLVRSGDKVVKLQAVLSGTLNFLFNEYNGTESFASVIKKAKELGYTEPDPRLDLSGEDVLRKLLILIRESGYQMEMEQIEATSFLPVSCQKCKDLGDFYEKVEAEEAYFKSLFEKAQANGTRLKVIASYSEGKGTFSLTEVPDNHPFYNLEGKDNVVLFYTSRYSEQPMVIKGAGAGAEVTASGIFADILRIAQ